MSKPDLKIPEELNEFNLIFFSDGGCDIKKRNNTSMGLYILSPNSLNNIDTTYNDLSITKKIPYKTVNYNNKTIKFIPTNNRGEGYGILYSLYITYNYIKNISFDSIDMNNEIPIPNIFDDIKIINNKPIKIIIITDTQFWINTITLWSKKWISFKHKKFLREINYTPDIKKKKGEKKIENIDLVISLLYYYRLLKKNNVDIIFKHQRGHTDKKIGLRENSNTLNFYELGNIYVDKLAESGKFNNNYNIKKI